jgi:hypothetical protein
VSAAELPTGDTAVALANVGADLRVVPGVVHAPGGGFMLRSVVAPAAPGEESCQEKEQEEARHVVVFLTLIKV